MGNNIAISDFHGLNALKSQAKEDAKKALPEVAKQFEAIFVQSMLKSMRTGQHFLDESSPLSSKNEETFRDMLDAQYASSIAGGKGIGLAEALASQIERNIPDNAKSDELTNSEAVNKKSPDIAVKATLAGEETSIRPLIDTFVNQIWPYAEQAASTLGLDPKLLIAQAALETGWGQYVAQDHNGNSSNNLFNIKATGQVKGDAVEVNTTEYVANTPIKIKSLFRKYPTVEHSFNDYVSLIKGSDRYEAALANAKDPARYIDELYQAGYATDPSYASKVLSIYHGGELKEAIQRHETAAKK